MNKSRFRQLIEVHYFKGIVLVSGATFLLLSIPGFILNGDEYWSSYWPSLSAYIAIIAATATFYVQQKNDKKRQDKNRYIEFQEKLENVLTPIIINFLSDKGTSMNEDEAIDGLVKLLSLTSKIDMQRSLVLSSAVQNDSDIVDLRSFREVTAKIITRSENEQHVETIRNAVPNLAEYIDDLLNKREITIAGITDDDMKILGYWMLNFKNAEKAKYLVGVSTKTKRIVGAYALSEKPTLNEDDNRIFFNVKKDDKIYVETVNNSKEERGMPGLDTWTAQIQYFTIRAIWKVNQLH